MRLINVHTLKFKEFLTDDGSQRPNYAILSHRWGDGELTYKDWLKGRNLDSPGHQKIMSFCALVRHAKILWPCWYENHEAHPISEEHHFAIHLCTVDWIWGDTCCIDKKSSAELSEAINSMYAWYKEAVMCFVHLSGYHWQLTSPTLKGLELCEWFSRGWTLQELLAPRYLCFCDTDWRPFGHIGDGFTARFANLRNPSRGGASFNLVYAVSRITGIPPGNLRGQRESLCVAQKMSWASRRKTTRPEDTAYCLLGLFGVNMPLLYGEGSRAFRRLQEEIVKQSDDRSVLACEHREDLFADSPQGYREILRLADSQADLQKASLYTNEHRATDARHITLSDSRDCNPGTERYFRGGHEISVTTRRWHLSKPSPTTI